MMKKVRPAASPAAFVSALDGWRLKASGKYEMATLELRQGMTIDPKTIRRLARQAVALNRKLGDPTQGAIKP